MKTALLFDLDNTLLNDQQAKEKYLPAVYRKFSYINNVSFDEFRARWYQGIEKYIPLCESGYLTFEQQQRIRLEEAFSVKGLSDELINEYYMEITKEYEKNFVLVDNAIQVLNELKEKNTLALVSNGSSVQQWKKIRKFNLQSYFEVIIISQDVNVAKPNKEIFELAMAQCKSIGQNNYFIGDDFENDIKGSYNAGLIPIWYNTTNRKPNDTKVEYFEINNLNKIQGIVESMHS